MEMQQERLTCTHQGVSSDIHSIPQIKFFKVFKMLLWRVGHVANLHGFAHLFFLLKMWFWGYQLLYQTKQISMKCVVWHFYPFNILVILNIHIRVCLIPLKTFITFITRFCLNTIITTQRWMKVLLWDELNWWGFSRRTQFYI